jgi:hypothetical protein
MITDCGSRPCPVCYATGTDADGSRCRACEGTLFHPYPWVDAHGEEETPTYSLWTVEESAIVTAAPTLRTAVIGYLSVYGPIRTRGAISAHRIRVRHHPETAPRWSEGALEALVEAGSPSEAVVTILERYPTLGLSPSAIKQRYWRLVGPRAGSSNKMTQ